MPSAKRPHHDTYKAKRLALKRKGKRDQLPCWICRQPIDYDLDYRHAMSYTYDHDVPLAVGGDPNGSGKPAHRSCNSRRGDGRNTIKTATITNRSRNWLAGPPASPQVEAP